MPSLPCPQIVFVSSSSKRFLATAGLGNNHVSGEKVLCPVEALGNGGDEDRSLFSRETRKGCEWEMLFGGRQAAPGLLHAVGPWGRHLGLWLEGLGSYHFLITSVWLMAVLSPSSWLCSESYSLFATFLKLILHSWCYFDIFLIAVTTEQRKAHSQVCFPWATL